MQVSLDVDVGVGVKGEMGGCWRWGHCSSRLVFDAGLYWKWGQVLEVEMVLSVWGRG